MEQALQFNFKPKELLDINLVRLYLQITTVSDIATAVGTKIERTVWDVLPFQNQRSKFNWPKQEQPTNGQQVVWRKLLHSFLLVN